jgi:hypothetical protein
MYFVFYIIGCTIMAIACIYKLTLPAPKNTKEAMYDALLMGFWRLINEIYIGWSIAPALFADYHQSQGISIVRLVACVLLTICIFKEKHYDG